MGHRRGGQGKALIREHYRNSFVLEEIARFSKGRWVAVHCETRDRLGRPFLIRYVRSGQGGMKRPLTIEGPEDVRAILSELEDLRPRTFYASSAIFRRLREVDDVLFFENAVAFTPTWDIDNELRAWRATIEVAKAILDFLDKQGISKSAFVKWSGRGAHVHLHHGAFSPELLAKHGPLNVAYAVVEYVCLKLGPAITDITAEHGAWALKVENRMDPQRVFTCPLSLHRELDIVAICVAPDELEDFTPEWARPGQFRHWDGWDRFEQGEADELAMRALELVGGYPRPHRRRRRRTKRLTDMIRKYLDMPS